MSENQGLVKSAESKAIAPKTVREWIATDSFKEQVSLSLPKHLTADRFTRIALTAFNRTPRLADCTKESVFQCLLDCSALGIEPDGRRAHLIPFGKTCQLIIDYKGIVDLVRRSGEVAYIHADVVCENDEFDYAFGTGAFLKHKPNLKKRGSPKCVYSYVRLKDGSEDFDVMSVEDVDNVKRKSRSSGSGPWVDHWNEMAKKTVFRRHSKWLPLSSELREKLEKDDDALPMTEQERFNAARTVIADVTIEEPAQPVAREEKPALGLAN